MNPNRKAKYRVHKLVTWKWRKSPEPRDIQPKVMKDLGYQTAELQVVVYNPYPVVYGWEPATKASPPTQGMPEPTLRRRVLGG